MFICTSITPSVAIDNIKQCSIPISNNILYVGGTGEGNYTRIQKAINDARAGDTVYVYDDSSPYYENVIVDKSINLIGEDKNTTVIDGNKSGDVVLIYYTDWVNISEFTIQNSGTWDEAGISIQSDHYSFHHSDDNTITGNIISNNKWGIYLEYSNNNIITGNIISNNRCGLFLGVSNGNTITGNNIISNEYLGIWIYYSNNNTIRKNNLIFNKRNADFTNPISWLNQWDQNYWNRPRILPKIIFGRTGLLENIPWINIDWHPALKPYDI